MKTSLVLLASLLLAGCASKPPGYIAEAPHIQVDKDEMIALSNTFPDPNNPNSYDTFLWYRPSPLRNVRLGEGYENSGAAPADLGPGPSDYSPGWGAPAWSGYGGYGGWGGWGYGGWGNGWGGGYGRGGRGYR
jgi:hypothetical protein